MPNNFTPTPKPEEAQKGQAKSNANAAKSVPELRAIVAQLCDRVAELEKEVARLKAEK